jgi:hypothetical protein
MKYWEVRMKNLNERHEKDEMTVKPDADVVPFQRSTTLIPKRQIEELRSQWSRIQTNFVDEPRKAVADADRLVTDAIKQLEGTFTAQRSNLEKQWTQGQEVSTEDLRITLQHYREFFDRLLSLNA